MMRSVAWVHPSALPSWDRCCGGAEQGNFVAFERTLLSVVAVGQGECMLAPVGAFLVYPSLCYPAHVLVLARRSKPFVRSFNHCSSHSLNRVDLDSSPCDKLLS